MEGPGSLLPHETSVPKSRKKKVSAQKAPMPPQQDDSTRGFQDAAPPRPPPKSGKKSSQRGLKNGVSPPLQPPEFSPADSLPDLSSSGNEYRALRRKYLLLEEESGGLGNELREVEDEVRTLEEEKLALLDELVVLEGLIDRSELQSQGQR